MKKIVITILMCTLSISTLSGCEGSTRESIETTVQTEDTSEQTDEAPAYSEEKDTVEAEATAPDAANSQKMAEVEEFIKELYEAQTNKDVDRIRERLDDDVITDWAIRLGTLYSDEFCFQGYESIEVKVYPVLNEDYFVAYVVCDTIIEYGGETFALPGLSSLLVRERENSQWCITYGSGQPDEDELIEVLEEEALQHYDENYYWFIGIYEEYNNLIADTPALIDWLTEVDFKRDQLGASVYLAENDAWDYLFGEENGILTASLNGEKDNGDNTYIVQNGDCLWSIAEQELGDGMHWGELYGTNRNVIGDNPNLLWVGTELDLGWH